MTDTPKDSLALRAERIIMNDEGKFDVVSSDARRTFAGNFHSEEDARKWMDTKSTQIRHALQLAEGRLALLLKVYPDESETCDHPIATRYVLEQVRAALSSTTEGSDA